MDLGGIHQKKTCQNMLSYIYTSLQTVVAPLFESVVCRHLIFEQPLGLRQLVIWFNFDLWDLIFPSSCFHWRLRGTHQKLGHDPQFEKRCCKAICPSPVISDISNQAVLGCYILSIITVRLAAQPLAKRFMTLNADSRNHLAINGHPKWDLG